MDQSQRTDFDSKTTKFCAKVAHPGLGRVCLTFCLSYRLLNHSIFFRDKSKSADPQRKGDKNKQNKRGAKGMSIRIPGLRIMICIDHSRILSSDKI